MGTAPSKVSDAGDVEVEKPADSPALISTPSEKCFWIPAFIPTPSDKQEAYEVVIVGLRFGLRCLFRNWLIVDRHHFNGTFMSPIREQRSH